MKKTTTVALLLGIAILFSTQAQANNPERTVDSEKAFIKNAIQLAASQTDSMLKTTGPVVNDKYPRTSNRKGLLSTTGKYDWTPGFFPGTLWYLYEMTGDKRWKDEATKWTTSLEPLKTFTGHHDLGFMMYCSYGNAYRLDKKDDYKKILIESAKSLSTRYNPVTKAIKSWNTFKSWDGQNQYNFPVIIDNMMNLEMLLFASKVSGDNSFRDIAVNHANTTIDNHFRPDYSSYHVVCYDTETGKATRHATAQGYSDNSTWARGQAWAIYGYTMMYRETKDPVYLYTAGRLADWYLERLPSDKVPYWDFNAGQEGYTPGVNSKASVIPVLYRDASAACIVASALFELSDFTRNCNYREAAIDMLHSLASPAYTAAPGQNADFIIMHCVGSIPHGGEIDVPLVYADYYYIEALKRYQQYLNR